MMQSLKNIAIKFYSIIKKSKFSKMHGVTIGDYTYGLPTIIKFSDKYKVKIGKFCSISTNVKIFVDANHRVDWVTTYPISLKVFNNPPVEYGHPTGKGDVIIGHDVWIGSNVLIMSGVTIGNGVVIGAGSVVTKNVSDYEIVGGNPAKHIRFRFSAQQINDLLKIAWWDWQIDRIRDNANLLESSNIDNFIKKNAV